MNIDRGIYTHIKINVKRKRTRKRKSKRKIKRKGKSNIPRNIHIQRHIQRNVQGTKEGGLGRGSNTWETEKRKWEQGKRGREIDMGRERERER